MKRLTREQLSCFLLLLAILLTLVFIFGNSLASPEQSGATSDKVNDIISDTTEIITGKPNSELENFLTTYSRKIAHVVEFALLGLEVILLLHLSQHRRASHLLAGAFFAFVIASTDELIQSFTERGDMVSDVWIDVSGYIAAYCVTMLFLWLFAWRKRPKPASLKERAEL